MFLGKSLDPSLILLTLGTFYPQAEALTVSGTPLKQTQEAAKSFTRNFSNKAQFNFPLFPFNLSKLFP
jgi:hypothetical protein